MAPQLFNHLEYMNGGTLYWHVAAKDADGNVGSYTADHRRHAAEAKQAGRDVVQARRSRKKLTTSVIDLLVKSAQGQPDLERRRSEGVRRRGGGHDAEDRAPTVRTVFKLHPTKAGKITGHGDQVSAAFRAAT